MTYNYCALCGGQTSEIRHGHEHFWECVKCGQQFFKNPKPAAEAILITSDDKVVLGIRGRQPHKGDYDLPGGFVDSGENFQTALKRELQEELGLSPDQYSELVYIDTYTHKDYPWGKDILEPVNVQYTAKLVDGVTLKPDDDIAKVETLPLNKINHHKLSWDGQYKGIIKALDYWSKKA